MTAAAEALVDPGYLATMSPRLLSLMLLLLAGGASRGDDRPSGEAPQGMVWIPGGTYTMGSNDHYPEEAPTHRVSVNGFWMDTRQVTNADFNRPQRPPETAAVSGEGTYSFGLKNNSSNSIFYSSIEGVNPPQLVIETV